MRANPILRLPQGRTSALILPMSLLFLSGTRSLARPRLLTGQASPPVFFLIPFLFAISAELLAKEPYRPSLGPHLPSITARCGELTLMLRQSSQWTPGRIDYQGIPMTTEKSAYGSVFSFPGIGFIGTNHFENEPEVLTSLDFFLDDKPLKEPAAELSGAHFRFVRESRIRDFKMRCEITVQANRVFETTRVSTAKAAPLKLVYHFMHAWSPTVDAYLAGSDEAPEETIAGRFLDSVEESRKFHVLKKVDWIAVREPASGQFAVSRLLEAPDNAQNLSMIWNVPGTYRKYYLKCFDNDTVPAGFDGTWRMVTGFGVAGNDDWEPQARALAAELAK